MNTQSIPALRPEIWQKELYKDVIDNLFFANKNMIGKDTNNIIQIKDELAKEEGDAITFGLSGKLSGEGVDGDDELEGQEEEISSYAEQVTIDQKRFGVKLKGKLDSQSAAYDMRSDAKEKLAIRLSEFIERQYFIKLAGITSVDLQDVNGTVYSASATWSNSAPIVPAADEAAGTGDRYLCADSDGLDSLAATDVMTLDLITRIKVKAQLSSPKIRPLKIGGENIWVLFLHPWQVADLKAASGNWSLIQRDAEIRGKNNPIFSGALGFYNGVLLHEHEYVPVCQASSDFSPGATAAGAQAFRALLCGRQAGVMAETKFSKFFVEEPFDFKNKVGYATGMIGGIQKPAFNSLDYGVIALDTGATAL